MSSTSNKTGKLISRREAILESVRDIITTEKYSRPFDRDYGVRLKDLIDSVIAEPVLSLIIKTRLIEAIEEFEPEFIVDRIETRSKIGSKIVRVFGRVDGEEIRLDQER